MATAIKITYEDQPISLYDKTVADLGFTDSHDGQGLIFHWVEQTENGFVVHDVWESLEAFQTFKVERLDPLGMPDPTNVEVHTVHNFLQ